MYIQYMLNVKYAKLKIKSYSLSRSWSKFSMKIQQSKTIWNQRKEAERMFPNSFYVANITLIPTPNKDMNRKLQTSLMNTDEKNP